MSSRFLWLVTLVLCCPEAPALGCTVCGFGQDGTQFAFILTTGILTFMPLAMIGGICYFIYRRVKQHDQAS